MLTSNRKGQLATSKALARSIELGYYPAVPVMDCRYDLILDDTHKISRVQVKYANGVPSHASGSVIVKLAYETRQRRKVYTYNQSEVDALVVYIPKIDRLCWFPCEAFVGKKVLCVRIDPPLNGQKTKIFLASDYLW